MADLQAVAHMTRDQAPRGPDGEGLSGLGNCAFGHRRACRDLTLAALRRRTVADVPVGVLFSGSVDSSLITGLLAETGTLDLRTYAIAHGLEARVARFAERGRQSLGLSVLHDNEYAINERLFAGGISGLRFGGREVLCRESMDGETGRCIAVHDRPEYVIIEANERHGLANHEPQPTAERFVDLLFPFTA